MRFATVHLAVSHVSMVRMVTAYNMDKTWIVLQILQPLSRSLGRIPRRRPLAVFENGRWSTGRSGWLSPFCQQDVTHTFICNGGSRLVLVASPPVGFVVAIAVPARAHSTFDQSLAFVVFQG